MNLWSLFKSMVYSIKLKVEFVILNQLIDATKSSIEPSFGGTCTTGRETEPNNFNENAYADDEQKRRERNVTYPVFGEPRTTIKSIDDCGNLKTIEIKADSTDSREQRDAPNIARQQGISRSPSSSE